MSRVAVLSLLCLLAVSTKSQAQSRYNGRLERNLTYNASSNSVCPTWFQPIVNASDREFECVCTDRLLSAVHCDYKTKDVFLNIRYCMTYDEEENHYDVGSCPFGYYHKHEQGLSYKLPQNLSELNEFMCSKLNRKGRLCGRCKEGYGLSPYSAHMNCTPCSHSVGWVWYLFIDFVCQTIFFAFLFLFRINVTSPTLNAFVLFSQIVTSVDIVSLYSLVRNTPEIESFLGFGGFCFSLINVWKLEFFVLVAPPSCLSESLTTLQIAGLGYVSALYPLLLILLLYLLIRVRDLDWRPLVTLWRPLKKAKAKLSKCYKFDQPITKAFATVFLLSYVKVTDVSYSLLLPTQLYNVSGLPTEKRWFYDASVKLFTCSHTIYGVLALLIFFTYSLALPLVLFLYPFKVFQRCLGKLKHGQNTLKIFMDIMQCHYKDGLDGKRDLRSFSAVYFWIRFVFISTRLLSVFYGWHYSILSILFLACALFVVILRPYKKNRYNLIDCFFLCLLAFEFHAYFVIVVYSALSKVFLSSLYLLFLLVGMSPILYFFGYFVHHVCAAVTLPSKWKAALDEKRLKLRLIFTSKKKRSILLTEQESQDELELPDRCVHPELYDTLVVSYSDKTSRPVTI